MSEQEKIKSLRQLQSKMIDKVVDIYDTIPEKYKDYLEDHFWDLVLDTHEKYDARRTIQGFKN